MLEDYLKKLREKYDYADDLMDAISKILPALIEYYGDEYQTMILEALYSCEIYTLKDANFDLSKSNMPFYNCHIIIKNNNIEFKNIIYLPKVDLTNNDDLATLVHELCHLIKSFNRQYVYKDKIVLKTGLSQKVFDLQGNPIKEENKNEGIDEAFNCYDTSEIMSIILGYSYKEQSYQGIAQLAAEFMSNQELKNAIIKALFTDDNEWISLLGEENAKILSYYFDNIIEFCNYYYADNEDEMDPNYFEKHNKAWNLYDESYSVIEEIASNYINNKKK